MTDMMRTLLLLGVTVGMVFSCANKCSLSGWFRRPPLPVRSEMLVTTDWLASNLSDPKVVILHIADTPQGYSAGHIPGARFVKWEDIAATRDGIPNELPPTEALVSVVRRLGIEEKSRAIIYDEDGGLYAARLYVTLDYLGLGECVALLDGHWKKWKAEGRPVSTVEPAVTPSNFTPHFRPDVIISFQEMRDLVKAKTEAQATTVTIIDARPNAQYTGKESGKEIKRAGHIPGAVSVYWMQNVVGADNPVLRPARKLLALYSKAGAKPGHPTVTYCRSGVQASHTYFTAKYLGYDARLYDGSYLEWSAAKDTPVNMGKKP